MLKRGQITFFIVIGIVIFGILGLVYVASEVREDVPLEKQLVFKSETDAVKEEIRSCLDTIAKRYLKIYGLEGGALTLQISDDTIDLPVQVYYDQGNKTVPRFEFLEEGFSRVMENLAPACADIEHLGYQIETRSEPIAAVQFGEQNTLVTIDYEFEISARNGTDASTLSKFSFEYPFAIKKYVGVAEQIVEKIQAQPELVDLVFLASLEYEIGVDPKGEDFFVYSVIDRYGSEDSDAFVLNFGVLFEKSPENNAPVFINLKDSYTILAKTTLHEDIHAIDPDGDRVYFSLESDVPGIGIDTVTGLLTYDPKEKEFGRHTAVVYVDDGKGMLDKKQIVIDVI